MSRQWAREQLRRNEAARALETARSWALRDKRLALCLVAVAAGLIALGGAWAWRASRARASAWERLSLAQGYAYQGRLEPALEQLRALDSDRAGAPAAGFGRLFAGDILFRQGRYGEAAAAYRRAMEGGPQALEPLAWSGLLLSQEAGGDCAAAAASAELFLNKYQDHFLAPQAHASLARCLQARGQGEKARSIHEKMPLLYPDTYWAQWARSRSAK